MAVQLPINTRQLNLRTLTDEGDLDKITSQVGQIFQWSFEPSRKGKRMYFACPIYKAAQKTGHVSSYKCSYRGRGFKSMAEVKRHLRNQHNAFVEKCSRCCCFFTDQQSLETHERMDICQREGIHKGQGPQSRLWNSLFREMFPDKVAPDNPCYHAGTSGHSAKVKSSSADVQEAAGSIQASLDNQRAQQQRKKVINLIDKIRNNVVSMEAETVAGEEAIMAKLLKSLPPLVEQTSSPTEIDSSGTDAANIRNGPDNPEIQSGTGPSCATPSFPATDPFIFDDQLNDFLYSPQSLDFTSFRS